MATRGTDYLALRAWLAEYRALRAEIKWLVDGADKYQNFAITLLGLLFTGLAWIIEHSPRLLIPTLLVVPFLFTLLGFLYCRQHEEVYVVAAYLKDYVRPRVRSLVSDGDMWGWEEFKAAHTKRWATRKGRTASSAAIVFTLRSMLFVAPSVGSLIAVIVSVFSQRLLSFHAFKHFVPALFVAWFVFNVIIVLVLGRYLVNTGKELPEQILRGDVQ